MKMRRGIALTVSTVTLIACGGGGSNSAVERREQQAQLRAQAIAKEEIAVSLAADIPCETNNQCGILLFQDEKLLCDFGFKADAVKAYSLISATARQAETAAAEQQAVVKQLRALETEPIVCPAVLLLPPPAPVCVANRCEEGARTQ